MFGDEYMVKHLMLAIRHGEHVMLWAGLSSKCSGRLNKKTTTKKNKWFNPANGK